MTCIYKVEITTDDNRMVFYVIAENKEQLTDKIKKFLENYFTNEKITEIEILDVFYAIE